MSLNILSWNINGLRSFKTDMKEFLLGLEADIICFQETKITRDMLEEPLAIVEGFSSYFSFCRKRSGYSGVATFCSQRATPIAAQEGLSGVFPGEVCGGGGSACVLPGHWSQEQLKDLDSEGRAVITQHSFKSPDGAVKEVCIINVYCPRVDPEKPERRVFKLQYYELMRQRAAAIRATGRHVIILGDINTSHHRIDHSDPDDSEDFEKRLDRRYLDQFILTLHKQEDKENGKESSSHEKFEYSDEIPASLGFKNCDFSSTSQEICLQSSTPDCTLTQNVEELKSCRVNCDRSKEFEEEEEFANYEDLLISKTDFQVVDTFRYFHPKKTDAFTCWNTLTNARATNYGTRIDYVLADRDFLTYVRDSLVLQDIMGSDHCPVAVLVEGELLPASHLPKSCTKFFPEFRGEQQKLSSYFQPKSAVTDNQTKTSLTLTEASKGFILTGRPPHSTAKRKPLDTKKKNQINKRACAEKQTTLSNFFNSRASGQKSLQNLPSSDDPKNDKFEGMQLSSSPSISSSQESSESNGDCNNVSMKSSREGSSNKKGSESRFKFGSQSKNTGWGFLMKAPAPPPLCAGHQEPCVLLTVKKKGPNLNKQFYTCSRGAGREGDPNARCNFFKWVGK